MNSPCQELDAFARLGAESVRVQVELGSVGWNADVIQIIQNGWVFSIGLPCFLVLCCGKRRIDTSNVKGTLINDYRFICEALSCDWGDQPVLSRQIENLRLASFNMESYWIGHVFPEVFVHSPWWSPEGSRRNSPTDSLRNQRIHRLSARSCGTPWLRSIDLRLGKFISEVRRAKLAVLSHGDCWDLLGLHLCYNLPLDEKHKKLKHSEVESDIG